MLLINTKIYHMSSRLGMIYFHVLKSINHWFTNQVTLCNDGQTPSRIWQQLEICTPKSNFKVLLGIAFDLSSLTRLICLIIHENSCKNSI